MVVLPEDTQPCSQLEKSIGPKSLEDKARSARRGFKGGMRETLRELARMLREQANALKDY
jgi:hypothetical protein